MALTGDLYRICAEVYKRDTESQLFSPKSCIRTIYYISIMFISSKLLLLLPLYPLLASAITVPPAQGRSADAVVQVIGTNMGSVATSSGDTRIFYQDASDSSTNGAILQIAVTNDFATGSFEAEGLVVPADEVRQNSPVAVSYLSGDEYEEIHVAFFSPDNILSEYYYTAGIGFQGGANCTTCVTSKGFVGAAGSQMLYALATTGTSPPILRFGFVADSGDSNTISEAINDGSGWIVSTLT
jgi:hypothetical protein